MSWLAFVLGFVAGGFAAGGAFLFVVGLIVGAEEVTDARDAAP